MNFFRNIHNKKLFLGIFCLFLLIHCIIFRRIIFETPSIIRGESTIARDELIPFFNFDSQFFDQIKGGISELTLTDEIRLSYSFWTAWVRYNPILPFALILLNTISAFVLFLSVYLINLNFYKNKKYIFLTSFLGALVVHLILLYSKVTHFYTLIFGFSLFALAVSLLLKSIFFQNKFSAKDTILISALVLFNPAIHYHVLFYLTFVFIIIVNYFLLKERYLNFLRENIKNLLSIVFFSLVPYLFLILYISNVGSVQISDSIPVNYWSIVYSSTPISHLLSLDLASPIDVFKYGSYLTPIARYSNLLLLLVIFGLIIFYRKKFSDSQKNFLKVLSATFFLSLFMAIGYEYSFSFHGILAGMMKLLSSAHNLLADIFERLVNATFQILRFPQRFTFVTLYVIAILISISLGIFANNYKRRFKVLAILAIVVIPFFSSYDYLSLISSGNFSSFLEPLRIPDDLKEIKKQVQEEPGKVFILPTLESGRNLVIDGKRYNFIDKFLIYYLNTPTFYYGTSSQVKNKVYTSLVYQGILDQESWWEEILNQSLDIEYILQPKTERRESGIVYLPSIDLFSQVALDSSKFYGKVYSGDNFNLYKRIKPFVSEDSVLVDMGYSGIQSGIASLKKYDDKLYFPLDVNSFISSPEEKFIVTDNPERTYYEILSEDRDIVRVLPSAKLIPFTSSLISSSFYTNLPLSFSTLIDATNPYNFIRRPVYDVVNLNTAQFIATTNNTIPISFNFNLSEGDYYLYLRASSPVDQLKGKINKLEEVNLFKIDNLNQRSLNFTYFRTKDKVHITSGSIEFLSPDSSSLITESLIFVPEDLVFQNTEDNLGSTKINFSPTLNSLVFKLNK